MGPFGARAKPDPGAHKPAVHPAPLRQARPGLRRVSSFSFDGGLGISGGWPFPAVSGHLATLGPWSIRRQKQARSMHHMGNRERAAACVALLGPPTVPLPFFLPSTTAQSALSNGHPRPTVDRIQIQFQRDLPRLQRDLGVNATSLFFFSRQFNFGRQRRVILKRPPSVHSPEKFHAAGSVTVCSLTGNLMFQHIL